MSYTALELFIVGWIEYVFYWGQMVSGNAQR